MRKKPFENKVVVIGADHHTTLAAIRSLGEEGVDVYAILQRSILNFVGKSKYVRNKVWYIDSVDQIKRILYENFPSEKRKTILLTCSDELEAYIDRNRNYFNNIYLIPSTTGIYGSISKLMNKDYMSQVAQSIGILVPCSIPVYRGNQNDSIKQAIFPCLCKPLKSASGSPVGGTYIICNNADELTNAIHSYFEAGFDELLVNEYINTDVEISIEGCSFGTKEKPYIPAIQIKEKAFKENNGSTTTSLLSTNFSDYIDIEKINRLLMTIGYSGVFDLEFRIKPEGAYLLDVNLRVGGCSYGMTRINGNIIYEWCLYVAVQKHSERKQVKRGFIYVNEFFYAYDLKRKLCRPLDLLKDLVRRKAFAVINFRDPLPFLSRIRSKTKRNHYE